MNRSTMACSAIMTAALFAGDRTFAGTTRPADDGRQTDNPIYQACAKFKPGSTATYTITAASAQGRRDMTISFELRAITPDAATLATTVTTPGRSGDPYASSLPVPARMSADQAWPVPSGNEDVTVAGRALHCRVFTMRGPLPMATHRSDQPTPLSDNKLWVSDDVPGGLVKMQSDRDVSDETGKAHLVMTLTAFAAK